jgi:hypothetical protein
MPTRSHHRIGVIAALRATPALTHLHVVGQVGQAALTAAPSSSILVRSLDLVSPTASTLAPPC